MELLSILNYGNFMIVIASSLICIYSENELKFDATFFCKTNFNRFAQILKACCAYLASRFSCKLLNIKYVCTSSPRLIKILI